SACGAAATVSNGDGLIGFTTLTLREDFPLGVVSGLNEPVNSRRLGCELTGLVLGLTGHTVDGLRGPHRASTNRGLAIARDIQVDDGVVTFTDISVNGHTIPDVVPNNRSLVLITIVLESGGHIHLTLRDVDGLIRVTTLAAGKNFPLDVISGLNEPVNTST